MISDESKTSEFLTVMLRQQFILFYRFGHTYIPSSGLIEIENGQTNSLQDKLVELFSKITPFEYDEEYLIIRLSSCKNDVNGIMEFTVQDIVSITPLSEQALRSIETKSDPRIAFAEPLSPDTYSKIESLLIRKDIDNAILSLFRLCGVDTNPVEVAGVIVLENLFEGLNHRRMGKKATELLNRNIWEIAMAYDRYDYYPKNDIGFFLDALQVFGYSKGYPDSSGSSAFKLLQRISHRNAALRFDDIVDRLETGEEASNYLQLSKKNGIREYVVAPMFFMLRNELRECSELKRTSLFSNPGVYEKFGNEYHCALILLAAFFGFKKFYDDYYDTLNLKFFKEIPAAVEENKKFPKEKKARGSKANRKRNEEIKPDSSEIAGIANNLLNKNREVKIIELSQSLKRGLKLKLTNKQIIEALTPLNEYEFFKNGKIVMLRKGKIHEVEVQAPTLGFDK